MVRKGWSVMELPSDGWVKVLRGRRPPSEQWPPAKKSPAALSALGPEENAAKVQIQEALRRAKEVSQPVRPNPDTIQAEAVAKVERLQRALDAMGDLGGPEVDAIKRALKKAQEVA